MRADFDKAYFVDDFDKVPQTITLKSTILIVEYYFTTVKLLFFLMF